MPLEPLNLPQNNNRLLVGFCLSYLLPDFDDDDAFDAAVERLFGATSRRASSTLILVISSLF